MPESVPDLSFAVGALNVCTGGTQIIKVYSISGGGEVPSGGKFRLKPFFDDWGATTLQGVPQGDHWCVRQDYGGTGTIVLFRAVYTTLADDDVIYARVYDGLNGSSSETYYPNDSRYVPGVKSMSGMSTVWTWDHLLTGVTYSTTGIAHHVRAFKVHANGTSDRDDSVAFLAVPCTVSGSNGSQGQAINSPLASVPTLELKVSSGPYAGGHLLELVGNLVWAVTAGPLKGLIELASHGDTVAVRTPSGKWTGPVTSRHPFAAVLPGELFGCLHEVVVTAP